MVTRSSSGLGEAIAKMLASKGTMVIIYGHNLKRAEAVAAQINASGGSAAVVIGDLTTGKGADAIVAAVLSSGPVDILVNNAGVNEGTIAIG